MKDDQTVTITRERYQRYQTYELAFEDVREWLESRAVGEGRYIIRRPYLLALEYLREREKFHELVL